MEGGTQKTPHAHHKRGSERRQKQRRVTMRLTDQEHAEFAALAANAGLTIPSFIRESRLNVRETRSCVRRTVDADASMKLIAAINRVGNNINQIIKHWHYGEVPLLEEYREALPSLHAAIAAVLAAYQGREQ